MKDTFRFVETKKTAGVVDELQHLADKEDRSLNYYVGQVLKKHVNQNTPKNLTEIQEANETTDD